MRSKQIQAANGQWQHTQDGWGYSVFATQIGLFVCLTRCSKSHSSISKEYIRFGFGFWLIGRSTMTWCWWGSPSIELLMRPSERHSTLECGVAHCFHDQMVTAVCLIAGSVNIEHLPFSQSSHWAADSKENFRQKLPISHVSFDNGMVACWKRCIQIERFSTHMLWGG